MIRVVLPAHLKNLARVSNEVRLEVTGPVTQRVVLDALEARYPMLRGTMRDHRTGLRRAFVRFYACEEDLSNESPENAAHRAGLRGHPDQLLTGGPRLAQDVDQVGTGPLDTRHRRIVLSRPPGPPRAGTVRRLERAHHEHTTVRYGRENGSDLERNARSEP